MTRIQIDLSIFNPRYPRLKKIKFYFAQVFIRVDKLKPSATADGSDLIFKNKSQTAIVNFGFISGVAFFFQNARFHF